jgi:hypothetical protein
MEPKWLTSEAQVPGAEESDLLRTLLTCDGAGAKVKEAALNELLRRALLRVLGKDPAQ